MEIQFINHQGQGIRVEDFNTYINRLKKHVPPTDGILNVVFVTDVYIQSLNKQYRHKDKPTDVLSFSYQSPDFQNQLIGEIYISLETAKKQSKEHHHSLQDELNKLFVHGFLHIFGYDHEHDEDYKEMAALESKILSD